MQVAPSPRPEAINRRQSEQHGRGDRAIAPHNTRQAPVIQREGHRDRRHSARLRHQQQHPSVNERDGWMPCFAQVQILPACSGQTRRQFGPNKGAEQRKDAAERPNAQNQRRIMNAVRDLRRIGENARADDSAHHDQSGVEQSELSFWLGQAIGYHRRTLKK